jgi:cysteinyl-tRNA synthetase
MGLKLYNSLTRRKEEFKPLEEGRVGIYVCGPTVYGHPHLGHAKSYVSFDILVRYLRYLGYSVTYVQNITDVGHLTDDADEGEDKLVVAAKKEKKHPMALAEYYTRSYFEDMDRLYCHRPDISPRATGHIIEQIELVKILLEKGYAYEVNGSVYFEVAKFADYGKLSRRNLDEMLEGVRVEVSPDKKTPADFALWKKAEPNHIMQWPSPWGPGFPGWHLECSVMSMKYLGKTIDIHGGGLENQFPHHDCEIAQSEAANGLQFVRLWMHNNMITVDNQVDFEQPLQKSA